MSPDPFTTTRRMFLGLSAAAAGGITLGQSLPAAACGTTGGTDRPLILNFDWSTPPSAGYGAGSLVIVNWWGARKFASRIAQIRQQDAEVLEYTLPVHDYPWDDGTNSGIPEVVRFYTGGSGDVYRRSNVPTQWYWDPSDPDRVAVPNYGGRVMDLRPDSAWFRHLLDVYYPSRLADPAWKLDGFQLDVLGDGYLGWMTGASAAEQDVMRQGMRWFATELRAVVGEQCLLISNNVWQTDNDAVDGIMVESHDGDEIGNAFWTNALARTKRCGRRRNVTINKVASDACAWAAVDGVDHAGFAPNNSYDIGPSLPVGPCGLGNHGWPAAANHIHLWDSTTFDD